MNHSVESSHLISSSTERTENTGNEVQAGALHDHSVNRAVERRGNLLSHLSTSVPSRCRKQCRSGSPRTLSLIFRCETNRRARRHHSLAEVRTRRGSSTFRRRSHEIEQKAGEDVSSIVADAPPGRGRRRRTRRGRVRGPARLARARPSVLLLLLSFLFCCCCERGNTHCDVSHLRAATV